jgi:Icc-related predicted phosphoesterase
MKLLLFSDLHSDFRTASKLVEMSKEVDVVIGAGDFCIGRRGLAKIISALAPIKKPGLVVCGHIHASSGMSDRLENTVVINAGPHGIIHGYGENERGK